MQPTLDNLTQMTENVTSAQKGETAMKIPMAGFSGVTRQSTSTMGDELHRDEIEQHGRYIGAMVYVRRRHKGGGSTYGWRNERAPKNSALHDSKEVVEQMLQTHAAKTGA